MSKEKISGTTVASNFAWNLMERWGAQGVTFIVSIILARLLDPVVYGTVALVEAFTAILAVFIDSGLGSALVQKKDTDDLDFSTVFIFNVTMCIILYWIMFFSAPYIADFYNRPELVVLVRVISLTLVIAGVKNILVSVIQRSLQYKKFFFATLGGTIGAAVIGIFMAYKGFGVWALVAQSLFNSTVDTIILWITVKWKPQFRFSFSRLKRLLPFGSKILLTTLISTFYGRLRQLVIGKMYSAEDLAYYNKASGWPNLLFVNIAGAVDSVMFPVMSRAQEDLEQIKSIMSRTIKTNTFVAFPMLAGLSVCAKPAVEIILTAKWLPIVPYMQVFCLTFAMESISNTNLNMMRSIGRSDVFLKVVIIRRVVDLIILVATIPFSPLMLAYGLVVANGLGQVINCVVVKKLLNYSYKEQLKDVLPNIAVTLLMMIPVYLLSTLNLENGLLLTIQVLVGIVVYIFAAFIFKIETFGYLVNLMKRLVFKK